MDKLMRKKRSQKQEKDLAMKIGGKPVVASGAKWGAKGDVRTDEFLIEAKYTDKISYTLKVEIWEKIRKEAIGDHGRMPLMQIDLCGGEEKYMVFDIEDLPNDKYATKIPCVYKNRIRIEMGFCGYSNNGYTFARHFGLAGKLKKYELCAMLYKDFENTYLEE